MRKLPERLQELASAYAQLASSPDPGELQRRQQRRRRSAAAASLTLVAVLLVGAVVASGWVGAARRPAPGPAATPPSTNASTKATTPPPTTRPPRLTGTITRPQEGYQLQLPAGWYAVELSDPKQLALEYGRQQGRSAAEVFVRTALTLDPRLTGASDRKAAVLASTPGGPETETFANRPATAATRPDGRRFLRIDVNLVGGIPDLLYQIAWPYHCAPNSACPASARLRVLEFVASSSNDHWARVRPMLEQMVTTVRPIGNAIGGTAPAHPPCAYGRNGDVNNPHPAAKATGDGGVLLQVGVASRGGLPCHFRGQLAIRLVDRRRAALAAPGQQPSLLPVQDNGATVDFDGELPEGSAGSGVLSATWKWTNWCDSRPVSAQVVGPGGEVTDLAWRRLPLPQCTDRAAPSILTLVKRHG